MSRIPTELRSGAVRVNTAARSVKELLTAAQIVPGTLGSPAVPEGMPGWYVTRGGPRDARLYGVFGRSVGTTPGLEFLYTKSGTRLDSVPMQEAIDIVAAGQARYLNPRNTRDVVGFQRGTPGRDAIPATPASTRDVVTIGIAGVGRCEAGGVSAYSASAWCAVGLTRLRQSAGRIYGKPCKGIAPAAPGMYLAFDLGAQANAATGRYRSGRFTAPVTGQMVLRGVPDNFLALNGKIVLSYGEGANRQYYAQPVTAGEAFDWAAVNTGGFAGGMFWVEFVADTEYGMQTAVDVLEWAWSGLPWWGTIDAAARAGRWVRRATWTDAARAVRFEAGAGTARAVAVDNKGEVVTPAAFGVEEWLAGDWIVINDTEEPPDVDVTDWVFEGPGNAVLFAVPYVSFGGGGTSLGGGSGGTTPVVPAEGEGFLYVRDGRSVLVPAKDCAGAVWRPAGL